MTTPTDTDMNDRKVLTVTELNNVVRALLENEPFFSNVCVIGELSNYKIYPSGHHYFTLKDAESSLRCVMFKSSALKLRFRPENGMKVTVSGSLRVYPRDGTYQLYCAAIIPEGIGDLQIAFEQLKQKLSAEGLFDSSHKIPIPVFPQKVAIVTSAAGAAVHDMIRIFGRRWPMAKLIILPVRVQGNEAPAEIAGAIRYANEDHIADVIITGRGGGSLEDLWAFNDERVARAIYASEIPVISAVGHEPDVTISDYVADRRASTPSNAAEIAVPDQTDIQDSIRILANRMKRSMTHILSEYDKRLNHIRQSAIFRSETSFADLRRMELDRIQEKFLAEQQKTLMEKRSSLSIIAASLDAMSPFRILARGYAYTADSAGRPVSSVRQIEKGETLSIRYIDGSADVIVMDISVAEDMKR